MKFGEICNHQVVGGIAREFFYHLRGFRKYFKVCGNFDGDGANSAGFGEALLIHLRLRARARNKQPLSSAQALFVQRAESTSWTFGPIRGPLRAVQHLMSQKPAGFASFRRCQLAGGEVWAGLWDCVWWVYGVWGVGRVGSVVWSWACG